MPQRKGMDASACEALMRDWAPIRVLVDHGLPDREIRVTARAIAETLGDYGCIGPEAEGAVAEDLSEFLQDVLDEHCFSLDDLSAKEFSRALIAAHNSPPPQACKTNKHQGL